MANEKNLKPFPKGVVQNPNGRPKKWVTTLKESGYRKAEINDTIEVLLSMNLKELQEVFQNEDATILEKTVANALKKSLEKGTLYSLETLLSRVHGAPKQQIEQDIKLEQSIFRELDINTNVHTDNGSSKDS